MTQDIPHSPPGTHPQRASGIRIVHGDLLQQTDLQSLVSFLTEDLSWGGPVNQMLLREAGPRLDEYVLAHIIRPRPGEVFLAPAFGLPFKHLIFCIIPKWNDGLGHEEKLLKICYKNALNLAADREIGSVGFPALGSGRRDFPLRRAARIALGAIQESLPATLDEVRVVCKTKESFEAYKSVVSGD